MVRQGGTFFFPMRMLPPLPIRLALFVLLASGCGRTPVMQEDAYACAQALYRITNRRLGDQLPAIRTLIETSRSDGRMTTTEADVLLTIVVQGENGDWERASRSCRKLLEGQVRVAAERPPVP